MGDGADGAAASAPPAAGPGFSYLAVFHNYPLVAALVGFAIAQSIKFFVTCFELDIMVLSVGMVMYDASGIRLHAGKQAAVLNQIVCELPSEHPLAETRPLRELLGHTPTQVCSYVLFTVHFLTIWQNETDGCCWRIAWVYDSYSRTIVPLKMQESVAFAGTREEVSLVSVTVFFTGLMYRALFDNFIVLANVKCDGYSGDSDHLI
ncbi:hypothetical protein PR202_ga08739 [Eleusine coracana subsp. coracana]|uniref:Uncharacterized protein n=1 Tax=Eleusine coracana subsp. coracana TaxID=191504 RepID=A0AAV5C1B8_ELECO|nr:hypothetical protein PR202_ga08739 [Eleusine coracana subsp. coracana]